MIEMVTSECSGAPAEDTIAFDYSLGTMASNGSPANNAGSALLQAVLEHVESKCPEEEVGRGPSAAPDAAEAEDSDSSATSEHCASDPRSTYNAVLLGARAAAAEADGRGAGGSAVPVAERPQPQPSTTAKASSRTAAGRAGRKQAVGAWRSAAVDGGIVIQSSRSARERLRARAAHPSEATPGRSQHPDGVAASTAQGSSGTDKESCQTAHSAESLGAIACFKIRGEVLKVNLPQECMTPLEVAAIWEQEWGCQFAGRLKFGAPASHQGGKWLNPRTDSVPLDPDVVLLEGAGSILDTVAAALKRYGLS